jgi:thiol-disulfide isomerase/thioredoxin
MVLLNFWATWCPPCVKEMPSLQRLQQQFDPNEFRVVLINLGQTASTVNGFLEEQTFGFNLPVYLDDKGKAFTELGIDGMPSSYLLNSEGYPIEVIKGSREWDHPGNIEAVEQLISRPKT